MGPVRIIEEGAFADFEFEATAETIPQLFGECGKAVFMAITDIALIDRQSSFEFNVSAETLEDLLFSFLSELIFIKDTKNLLFSDFIVEITGKDSLYCKAIGEPIDQLKHQPKVDVKAATYHKMKIMKTDTGYSVRVILDL
jgi:SHS2 domain-containing protein